MAEIREYRGTTYSIPRNDDGVWHYKIHYGHLRASQPRPKRAPVDGYRTHEEAIAAAERAIDEWLDDTPR